MQIADGAGIGYVVTINVHKVDDANQPFKGAKFKVVHEANNQVFGEYETDENGNITVNELLKDKYFLTETETPTTVTTNYNLIVVIASVLLVGAYEIVRKEVK